MILDTYCHKQKNFFKSYLKYVTFSQDALKYYQKQTLIFLNHIRKTLSHFLTYHHMKYKVETIKHTNTPIIYQYKHIEDELA